MDLTIYRILVAVAVAGDLAVAGSKGIL